MISKAVQSNKGRREVNGREVTNGQRSAGAGCPEVFWFY